VNASDDEEDGEFSVDENHKSEDSQAIQEDESASETFEVIEVVEEKTPKVNSPSK
jgi:hypothetical protein